MNQPGKNSDSIAKGTQEISLQSKAEILRRADLFASFPESTIQLLAKNCKEIRLEDEEVLCKEGDRGQKMWVVLSGKLMIYKLRKTINFLDSGDFLGEMSLVDHKPRAASIKGIGDVVLLEIDDVIFSKFILTEPKAVIALISTIADRARHNLDIIVNENQRLNCLVHDMRNYLVPLTISEDHMIKMLTLLEGKQGQQRQKDLDELSIGLKKMITVRDNLITLIDQTLSMGVNAKANYVRIPAKIVDMIHETAEEMANHKYLRNKKLTVKIVQDSIAETVINVLDVKRVLQNLIINSGYASEKNSEIEVRVENLGDNVQVSVIDTGSGIPDDVKPLILKEQYTSKPDGKGFGLMSCKEIIEQHHGGKLGFESTWGVGTTFYFRIPVKPGK